MNGACNTIGAWLTDMPFKQLHTHAATQLANPTPARMMLQIIYVNESRAPLPPLMGWRGLYGRDLELKLSFFDKNSEVVKCDFCDA